VLDVRPVLFVIGIIVSIVGAAMVLPALSDIASGHEDWRVFVASSAITLFVGGAMILTNRVKSPQFTLRHMFLLTTLTWVVVAGFGALPFAFASLDLSLADAYFESMSGLTTTGSTVIVGLDHAPPGILLWRGLLQLMGGVGIVAIAIAVLPALRIGGMQLFRLESSDKSDKVLPRATQIVGSLGIVYAVLSIACAVLYMAGGMSAFDAVVHSFATISTGGFANYDASFGYYDSAFIDGVGALFMLMGGMTFMLFVRASQGDWRSLWSDTQTRWYLAVALVFTGAISLWLIVAMEMPPFLAVRHSLFNVVSILTTTGLVSTDYSQWGSFPIALFFILTFLGGCSGSTSGGIKIFRFQMLYEIGRAHVHQAFQPSGVFVPKYNRRQITEAVTQSLLAFLFLYFVTFGAVAVALSATGLDLVTALSGSATALGNVGPGLGDIIGPAGNFAPLPDAAKWILSAAMLMGRLELMTIFVLVSRAFWRE
jgi:trk system potassium uptake protein TrkH